MNIFLSAKVLCTTQARVLTWKDAVEDLQFVWVLPPQTQDVVLPADHLAEDQHDGDGGQADEQEQRVGPLHDIQPLLMAHHLDSRRDSQNGKLQQGRETAQVFTYKWLGLPLTIIFTINYLPTIFWINHLFH